MRALLMALALALAAPGFAQTPRAVIADPPRNAAHPARLEVVHVPSGGVEINGLVFVAAGAGPHPTFVLFHGLPGNERNLDLAQAVRRAGWNVVTINYRGSWGSPGVFRFAHTLEDAAATLAYIRTSAVAAKFGIDPARIAVGGHSMGGWVTAHTFARDRALLGAVMISPGDLGRAAKAPPEFRPQLVAFMNDSRETLVGATGDSMVDELFGPHPDWTLTALAPAFAQRRALLLYCEDFVKADAEALIAATRANGGQGIENRYALTDHSWSDARIALSSHVVRWLGTLQR